MVLLASDEDSWLFGQASQIKAADKFVHCAGAPAAGENHGVSFLGSIHCSLDDAPGFISETRRLLGSDCRSCVSVGIQWQYAFLNVVLYKF